MRVNADSEENRPNPPKTGFSETGARSASGVSGMVGTLVASLIFLLAVLFFNLWLSKLYAFGESSIPLLFGFVLAFAITWAAGAVSRRLRKRSRGFDKSVAKAGTIAAATAAVVLDPAAALESAEYGGEGPVLSEKTEGILLGLVWTFLLVISFAAAALVARYWLSQEWSRFVTAFSVLSFMEWVVFYWIGPMNRLVKFFLGNPGVNSEA